MLEWYSKRKGRIIAKQIEQSWKSIFIDYVEKQPISKFSHKNHCCKCAKSYNMLIVCITCLDIFCYDCMLNHHEKIHPIPFGVIPLPFALG